MRMSIPKQSWIERTFFAALHAKMNFVIDLNLLLRTKIMTTAAELAQGLTEGTEQVRKIGTETTATLGKVAELETALANAGSVSPEVEAAFQALKAQVQVVDALIPDTSTPVADPAADAPVGDVAP